MVTDPELSAAMRGLLGRDSFPAVGDLLRSDPRLMSGAAHEVLARLAGAMRPDTDPLGPALLASWRTFLRRCTPETLDAVVPPDAAVIDPQVVAVIREELQVAGDAEAAYERDADPAHLDRAARSRTAVLDRPEVASAFPALRAALTNDAAGTRLRRFWVRNEPADLAAAGELFAASVDVTPNGSPRRPHRLGNLAVTLREIALRQGGDDILGAAETVAREAVALLPAGGAAAEILTNLALVLRDRYLRSGDPETLDEAVTHAERACEHSDGIGHRVMLADLLGQRFPHAGDTADLRRAVALLSEAVAATPPGSPDRPRRLVDLAIALTESHAAHGDPRELDRAVDCCTEAVAHPALAASPDLPAARVQLAMARYRRFEAAGSLDDLDHAVALLDDVVATASGREAHVHGWRVNLATALMQRSRRTGGPADRDRAIRLYEEASRATTGADRYAVLNNLGNARRERARASGRSGDHDDAVATLREALSVTEPGSSRRATTLANLGIALRDRAEVTGSAADLDDAVDATGEAVENGTPGDVDRIRRLFAHTETCRARANARTGPDAARDRRRADEAYREACAVGLLVDPESTMVAATDRGATATRDRSWSEAADAFGTALDALRALTTVQVERPHQEAWLRAGRSLPGRAAYALAAHGRPADALLALERGRATLLAEALGRSRLATSRPELRERYERASRELRRVRGAAP